MEPMLLSAQQAAEVTLLSPNRVRELAQKGEIPAVRIGHLWRFPVRLLHEWAEQQGRIAENSTANRGRKAS